MKKFIKTYLNENEERINFGLLNREYDDTLVHYIVNCCKSLEVLEYVKFLGYEYIDKEADIDTNAYILARKRGVKPSKKKEQYINLHDSRCTELRLKFRLDCKGEAALLTKKLLIPTPDDDGYYTIKGTKYYLMYQIVDNSTYTTKQSITLKSMMPVSIKVAKITVKDTSGVEYTDPIYMIPIFKKDVNIMYYYFAKLGVYKSLKYFSMDKIVAFTKTAESDNPEYSYFTIGSNLHVRVNKHFLNKYQYVRTIVFMILNICTNRLTIDDLNNKNYWVDKMGALGTTNPNMYREKGKGTLTFFIRSIDDTTKSILKVHPINSKHIYSILRWMIQNFDELRKKDNMDLDNKRLRCNEYISSLLTLELNTRVNRIIAMGNKVTMRNIQEIFKFPGDIIIQKLYTSGLLRFDDRVNDMDFYSKLKFTFKGPNSLGGKNDNTVAMKYRGIDPSYIGKIDINVCGTSDPGTSGVLTPFCKTDGLFFNGKREPEEFKYTFDKDIFDMVVDTDEALVVGPNFSTVDNYYDYVNNEEEIINSMSFKRNRTNVTGMVIDINLPDDEDF